MFPSSFFPGVNFGYANLCIITLEKSSNIGKNLQNEVCVRTGFECVEELEFRDSGQAKFVSQKSVYENVGLHSFLIQTRRSLSLLTMVQCLKLVILLPA